MSIYPVPLAKWFPKGDENHDFMKDMVRLGGESSLGCMNCGKTNMNWRTAYGHHSLPWGYGDVWCTKRCYNAWLKKPTNPKGT